MSDFGGELVRLMDEHGVGVRQLARACYFNPGHISNIRSGKDRPSAELADAIDKQLSAGGRLAVLAAAARPRARGARARTGRAVEALKATMADSDADSLDMAGDGLSELVEHYAHVIAVAPSAAAYDELTAAVVHRDADRAGHRSRARGPGLDGRVAVKPPGDRRDRPRRPRGRRGVVR